MGGSVSHLVFQPPDRRPSSDPKNPEDAVKLKKNERGLFLRTDKGEDVHVVHIRQGGRLCVVYSHGNAEDLPLTLAYFRVFGQALGVDVFLYDYVGYGSSTGKPSEKGVFESAEAVLRHLVFDEKVDPKSIVLYGRSLGSGPSIHLALYEPQVGGLIIQSGLLSVHRVAMKIRHSTFCDLFKNCEKIRKVKAPTLIIHGTDDEVVPIYHGIELYKRCPGRVPPLWVEGGRHNNLESYGGRVFYGTLKRFFMFVEGRLTR